MRRFVSHIIQATVLRIAPDERAGDSSGFEFRMPAQNSAAPDRDVLEARRLAKRRKARDRTHAGTKLLFLIVALLGAAFLTFVAWGVSTAMMTVSDELR